MSALVETKENLRKLPSATLCMLYTISKYHERYKFLSLIQTELITRGFDNAGLEHMDVNQSGLYDQILTGEIS